MTGRKLRAAVLVAQDRLVNDEIARRVGISPRSLDNWKAEPEFRAQVSEFRKAWSQAAIEEGIGDKKRRVRDLDELNRRAWMIAEERGNHFASEPKLAAVPGGKTGFIIHHVRTVAGKAVAEFIPDTALMQEIREIGKQAALELGQLVNKHAGPDGGPIPVNLAALSYEQLKQLEALANAARANGE